MEKNFTEEFLKNIFLILLIKSEVNHGKTT